MPRQDKRPHRLAKPFRRAVERRGDTIVAVAKAFDVSRHHLYEVLRGNRPSPNVTEKIAAYLRGAA
jgi:transposase-like protein